MPNERPVEQPVGRLPPGAKGRWHDDQRRYGEQVWVLMVNADDVTQYVSNCKRDDGVELIESLLARWKAGRADIPAHMNPDLPRAK